MSLNGALAHSVFPPLIILLEACSMFRLNHVRLDGLVLGSDFFHFRPSGTTRDYLSPPLTSG